MTFAITRRRYMYGVSFSVDISIGVGVVRAHIILGTIRIDLHTTVVAIVVDIKAVGGREGLHRIVVVCKHVLEGRADSAGEVSVVKGKGGRSGAASNPETATLSRRLAEHG
jgi:hypothetical protein